MALLYGSIMLCREKNHEAFIVENVYSPKTSHPNQPPKQDQNEQGNDIQSLIADWGGVRMATGSR